MRKFAYQLVAAILTCVISTQAAAFEIGDSIGDAPTSPVANANVFRGGQQLCIYIYRASGLPLFDRTAIYISEAPLEPVTSLTRSRTTVEAAVVRLNGVVYPGEGNAANKRINQGPDAVAAPASTTITLTEADYADGDAAFQLNCVPPKLNSIDTVASVSGTDPFTATFEFSKEIEGTTFTEADINVTNGAASNIQMVDADTYTATITPDGSGDVTISVAAGTFTDTVGNENYGDVSVTVDADADAPTVEILGAPAEVTTLDPFTVSIVFSEPVQNFVAGDVTVGNGAASNLQTSDDTTFTVDITPDGNGDVTIDVAAGVAQDGAGNGNAAATQVVVGVDTQAPTVEILGAPENFAPDLSPFTVTVAFSEDVTGFDATSAADFAVANGSVTGFNPLSASQYSVEIKPDGSGDVTLQVLANAAANGNSASTVVIVGSKVIEITQEVIAEFMLNRANGIVGNGPDLIGLLNGTHGNGGGPLGNLAINGNEAGMNLAFATSLSKIDRERARIMAEQAAGRIDDAHEGYGEPTPSSSGLSGLLPPRTEGYGEQGDQLAALSSGGASGLSGGTYGADLVDGTEDMAVPSPAYSAPMRSFDVWTEVYGSQSTSGDADSSLWIGYVGAHWFVNQDMIIGGLVQFDWAEEDNDEYNSNTEGHGWMAGPYIAGRMAGTSFAYEARAAWGRSDNSVSPFGTYEDDFETERWLVSGKVQGSYTYDALTITPSVQASYFEETQDSYTDSLGNKIGEQTITLGEVKFGPEFSQTMMLDDGSTLTPSFGIYGVWNFDITEDLASDPYPLGDDDLRARFDGGFSLTNTMGWIFSASGYYDGLGVDDYNALGGKVRVTVPLQ